MRPSGNVVISFINAGAPSFRYFTPHRRRNLPKLSKLRPPSFCAYRTIVLEEIPPAPREGRHVFYRIDAGSVAERLEGILAITRMLEAAMGADRATATKATVPQPKKPVAKGRARV